MCMVVVLSAHFQHSHHDLAKKNRKVWRRPLAISRTTSLLRTQEEWGSSIISESKLSDSQKAKGLPFGLTWLFLLVHRSWSIPFYLKDIDNKLLTLVNVL